MGLFSTQGVCIMSELHRVCVIPLARVEGQVMTVLRKLRKQGGIPLGYADDVQPGSLEIASWLNGMGAVGVGEHQVIPVKFVTSEEAAELVQNLNYRGQYREKYESSLPLTSWRRVKVSEEDFYSLTRRRENMGMPLSDVWNDLWENQNTSIGVPLALIWNLIYDKSKQTVE